MTPREAAPASSGRVAWLAWLLWGLSVAFAALGLFFLLYLNGSFASLVNEDSAGINAAVAVAFPTVGARQ